MIEGKFTHWHDEWKDFKGLNFFGKRFSDSQKRVLKKISSSLFKRPSEVKVLDVGCGYGETMFNLRYAGFSGVIGIDISKEGLKLCEERGLKIGKDIFFMNATKMSFKDKKFDMSFESGVLEHFKDFSPFVREMCRVSKKYVIISQPNHFSLWKRFIHSVRGLPVDEYTYTKEDFIEVFKRFGFVPRNIINYHLSEQFIIVFERKR